MAEKHSKYSLIGRINFEDLYNAFLGLEQRQQTILVLGSIVLLIIFIVMPVTCASSKLGKLQGDYDKSLKEAGDLVGKIGAYQEAKASLDGLKKQYNSNKAASLTTVMEAIANENGIGPNVDKLKPINLESTDYYDELGVDASLTKVSLDQVLSYLYKIENNQDVPLRVKKLQIKPSYQNRSMLNVTLQVSTIKMKGDSVE